MPSDILIREPTADEVRHLREAQGVGMFEARKILRKEAVKAAIFHATSVPELKIILSYMLKNLL